MATTLTKDRKTPGVFVTEFSAFPPSVVGVETAVPIFVGYTQTALDPSSRKQMYLQAVAITSMADYYSFFGYGYDAQGVVQPQGNADDYDFEAASADGTTVDGAFTTTASNYIVGTAYTDATGPTFVAQFNLFAAMQLFYANGGGNCFVISVDNYWGTRTVTPPAGATVTSVDKQALLDGLAVANDTRGGTMLVVPDACLLVTVNPATATTPFDYSAYQPVAVEMLRQSAALQDRVAILDMPGALVPANWNAAAMKVQADQFYALIAPASAYFSYGTCYGPALESSLLDKSDVDYTNLSGTEDSVTLTNNLLTTQALSLYPPTIDATGATPVTNLSTTFQQVAAHIAVAFPATGATPVTDTVPPGVVGIVAATATTPAMLVSLPNTALATAPIDEAGITSLDQYLLNAVPMMGDIQQILANKLNVVPPSGPMAGIWTQNDNNRGVWNAPANFAVNEVVAPKVLLSDAEQGNYNVPLNGNAIDILRAMVNRGTIVWGARTLDGNSLDYRYIQVRRTLIYIEQSIKNTLQQFVFAANDGVTWATVTSTISNFLTQLWQAGGLMGDKASDAFTVKCGVPTTMSGLDVLNGYMIVNVTVQMIHPAEFIELTFTQTMQGV
ncbi:phage tail sheath family protein [Sphingomonas hengshuiensis]|uniref:phage tail sheath family protein n=1 Tax=Sphingomonas hengshuiensis TaxID=1609977 RepID=UPI000696AB53|nr:phage tail sheath C-terminal domain-containing protein [Sphingomonas hengshuiensis]